MESKDVLAYDMHIGRPVFSVLVAVIATVVAKCCNIVRKCVNPNINNMLWVKVNRNTPLEGASAYAQILKTRLYEVVYHFLFTAFGIDEVRVAFDVVLKLFLIFRKLEEVCLLLCRLYLSATVGAFSVNKLTFCPEAFARCTVKSLIFTFVNVTLVVQLFEYLLNSLFVIVVGCSYKMVVGGVE